MKNKIILGGLLGLFVILFILSLIFTPPVQFNYLFGTIDYSVLLFIISFLLLISFIFTFDETRESKIYLDSNGNLDVSTPREYTPLKVTPISKVLGRANIYGQKNLDYFSYNDGKVHIRNNKGDEVVGSLEDLEYSYKMVKNRMTDEWYIYQFKIKDNKGNKVQFNRHNSLFNDEEYADIEMLLSLAGKINESKFSKLTKKLDSVVSAAQELDFSNLLNSTKELASTLTAKKIINKSGELAKKRIYDKLSGGKKSLFRKCIRYFLWILLILILIIIIGYNILIWSIASQNVVSEENYSNNYRNYSSDDSYTIEQNNNYSYDDEVLDDRPQDSFEVNFTGKIGKYPIEMTLYFEGLDEDDYERIEGAYRYTKTGSGKYIPLVGEKKNGYMKIYELNDKGEPMGYFDGKITFYIGQISTAEYSGTFLSSYNKYYSFSLDSDEIY